MSAGRGGESTNTEQKLNHLKHIMHKVESEEKGGLCYEGSHSEDNVSVREFSSLVVNAFHEMTEFWENRHDEQLQHSVSQLLNAHIGLQEDSAQG